MWILHSQNRRAGRGAPSPVASGGGNFGVLALFSPRNSWGPAQLLASAMVWATGNWTSAAHVTSAFLEND